MALPVNGSTHLIPAYYSFYRPRKDESLSWPSWVTYSRWLTHISGHPSAAGRAQDRESSPARDRRSTTVPCHQPKIICKLIYMTVRQKLMVSMTEVLRVKTGAPTITDPECIGRQWRNFVPAGFRRHLVGKPLKNAGYCNSA